jgi:two-component system chemotaxis sensor kinase CheA
MEKLAHSAEDLLSGLRDGSLQLDSELTLSLLQTADRLGSLLKHIEISGHEDDTDDSQLLAKIEGFSGRDAGWPRRADGEASKGVSSVIQGGYDESAKPIGQRFVELAEVNPRAVQAAREFQRQSDLHALGQILVSEGAIRPSDASKVVEFQQAARPAEDGKATIRIEVAGLYKIVRRIEDLTSLAQRINAKKETIRSALLLDVVSLVTTSLENLRSEALGMLMQPIAIVWKHIPRLVRNLAQSSSKAIQLVTEGGEIEIDRMVLDAIKNPLLHLVRNAVDHGIELQSERLAAGKSPEAKIAIRAYTSGDRVVIAVSDDGVGIDLEAVRQALARRKDLFAAKDLEQWTESELTNAVFLPGLTTAKTVTHISGRGVGMDVVKSNVERVGGSVEIETQSGKGTTVRIVVPRCSRVEPSIRLGGDLCSPSVGLVR